MGDQTSSESVLYGGLDEVGRGCIAGPMTVVVIAFPKGHPKIEGVADSKKLTKKKREELAPLILQQCSYFGEGWAEPYYIDQVGITEAWHTIANLALKKAPPNMELVVDGIEVIKGYEGKHWACPKADDKFWEVSAASIVAKVMRDRYMTELSERYPEYLWEKNAGYGTKEHRQKIITCGPSPYHRMTFLKKILKGGFDRIDKQEKKKQKKEALKMGNTKW